MYTAHKFRSRRSRPPEADRVLLASPSQDGLAFNNAGIRVWMVDGDGKKEGDMRGKRAGAGLLHHRSTNNLQQLLKDVEAPLLPKTPEC
jgi:hypothetical protein